MPGPIELEYTIYDDCSPHSFYAKGHHDHAAFLEAIRASTLSEEVGIDIEEDLVMENAAVKHQHWRKVPDESGDLAWKAVPGNPGPGAFPVTVLYF